MQGIGSCSGLVASGGAERPHVVECKRRPVVGEERAVFHVKHPRSPRLVDVAPARDSTPPGVWRANAVVWQPPQRARARYAHCAGYSICGTETLRGVRCARSHAAGRVGGAAAVSRPALPTARDLDMPAPRATRSAGPRNVPPGPRDRSRRIETPVARVISIRPLRGLLDLRDRPSGDIRIRPGSSRRSSRRRSRRTRPALPAARDLDTPAPAGYSIGGTRGTRRPVHATAAGYSIGGTAGGSADGGADHARRLVEHTFADDLDTRT